VQPIVGIAQLAVSEREVARSSSITLMSGRLFSSYRPGRVRAPIPNNRVSFRRIALGFGV
jgi:hypothetical protein